MQPEGEGGEDDFKGGGVQDFEKLMRTKNIESIWETRSGLIALVTMGAFRCGYVALPPVASSGMTGVQAETLIDVHGGVTFYNQTLLHIPGFKMDDMWIGFDCGHVGDANLMLSEQWNIDVMTGEKAVLRTLEYCKEECEKMARQIVIVQELLERGENLGEYRNLPESIQSM